MHVDQALHEMELVGHDFYLFQCADTGQPTVVYRRHAYDYGLIRLAPVPQDGAGRTRPSRPPGRTRLRGGRRAPNGVPSSRSVLGQPREQHGVAAAPVPVIQAGPHYALAGEACPHRGRLRGRVADVGVEVHPVRPETEPHPARPCAASAA